MKAKLMGVLSLILIGIAFNQTIYSQNIGLVSIRNAEETLTVGGQTPTSRVLLPRRYRLPSMLLRQGVEGSSGLIPAHLK
jgi:hypothetical protein